MDNPTSTVASITVICGLMGQAIKLSPLDNRYIPLIVGICGCLLGVGGQFLSPDFPSADLLSAAAVGISSGLASTGIHQAYTQLKGPKDDTIDSICKIAQDEIGVKEDPKDSNCVKYNTWFYGRAVSGPEYAWCMVFMQWLANQVGLPVLRTASCTTLANWAKQQKQWITKGFQKGDWVEFDFSGRRKITQHVGLVVGLCSGGVITVEGNTGSGSDANGGQVQKRKRALSLITGAWRPPYKDPEKKEDPSMIRYHCIRDIPPQFHDIISLLHEIGALQGYKSSSNNPEDLVVDLSHDMVRMFVCNYRAGAYDRALMAAGNPPAVPE